MRVDRNTASSTSWVTNRSGDGELVPDLEHQLLQDRARHGVDRREGLIHQQHGGLPDEARAMQNALLHAAGELIGVIILVGLQSDQADVLVAALARLRAADRLLGAQPELDILAHRAPGKDRLVYCWKT